MRMVVSISYPNLSSIQNKKIVLILLDFKMKVNAKNCTKHLSKCLAGNDLVTTPTRVIDNHNLINPDKLENI